mmetsp:Transcript_3856/g.10500  ORF Transcript_3856/g.10500 Transcript_3856/m.10500 type:complete len:153 (-) Transcript_3856:794-1252(-)
MQYCWKQRINPSNMDDRAGCHLRDPAHRRRHVLLHRGDIAAGESPFPFPHPPVLYLGDHRKSKPHRQVHFALAGLADILVLLGLHPRAVASFAFVAHQESLLEDHPEQRAAGQRLMPHCPLGQTHHQEGGCDREWLEYSGHERTALLDGTFQ